MNKITNETKQMVNPPLSNIHYYESSPASSSIKISPLVLLTIVIFSAIFFIAGLVHLLIRFLLKPPSFSPIHRRSNSHGVQRQLQQLFRLHDSGVDQSIIDALPVFYYKDVMGSKGAFDCAVCLSEFSDHHRLRLLPKCTHAFHIHCIDTWLLSNSTCPICRGTLSGIEDQNSCDPLIGVISNAGDDSEKRVFSVRLGKLRSTSNGENGGISSSLDGRRCYSMGAYQYVVSDSLQLALSPDREEGSSSIGGGDMEEKRIRRSKGESFSVSKIWLWSNKSGFSASSDVHLNLT